MEKINWQLGQVIAVVQETPRVKTFTLKLPQWTPHLPGQHYDLRLTAQDGYQAQRSYSIASPPEQTGQIDLTIEYIKHGEVSAYLHESIVAGDMLEVRGPIGGYFVWQDEMKDSPLLLVAGGSGVVPLMSMLRHRLNSKANNPTALLFSIRTQEDVIYQQELIKMSSIDKHFNLFLSFTRQPPPGWTAYKRRIDRSMLTDVLSQFASHPNCFVCGPTMLVELVANTLVDIGLPPHTIRTERFGTSLI
jgi:ferredoxin-NADP reductase